MKSDLCSQWNNPVIVGNVFVDGNKIFTEAGI